MHYGTEFLIQSINSIIESVDHVFVFYSMRPWCGTGTQIQYLGKTVTIPTLHEDVRSLMCANFSNKSKVTWHQYECETPRNQFRNLYDIANVHAKHMGYRQIETALLMEPDMIFVNDDADKFITATINSAAQSLSIHQIELWSILADHSRQKVIIYRIPGRPRLGPTCWNTKNEDDSWTTEFGTYNSNTEVFGGIENYNVGFLYNKETMLYKHLTAIGFSAKIGDSIPSDVWFEDKWTNWTPDKIDLEIAEKWRYTIKKADIYDITFNLVEKLGI